MAKDDEKDKGGAGQDANASKSEPSKSEAASAPAANAPVAAGQERVNTRGEPLVEFNLPTGRVYRGVLYGPGEPGKPSLIPEPVAQAFAREDDASQGYARQGSGAKAQ